MYVGVHTIPTELLMVSARKAIRYHPQQMDVLNLFPRSVSLNCVGLGLLTYNLSPSQPFSAFSLMS